MAGNTNENANLPEENPQPDDGPAAQGDDADVTNARHRIPEVTKLLEELKALAQDDFNRGFDIGDRVEIGTSKHKLKVADLVEAVGLSRTRLCDCRVTAVAFKGKVRQRPVPFHFFTLAARAADKFEIEPIKALDIVTKQKPKSSRRVSAMFASLLRQKQNGQALEGAGLLVAKHGELLDRCHHEDFRAVVARLEPGSVKLVIADPPYDGERKSTTSATTRSVDGNNAMDSKAAITDLLKLLADKMASGGAVALFRPGAAIDPAWLSAAVELNGWTCRWALTWNKHKTKLGRLNAPYGIASERLLILSRRGEKLTSHDDSARDDVLEFRPIQPHFHKTMRQPRARCAVNSPRSAK